MFSDYAEWHILSPEIPTLRHQAYRELCGLLRPLGYEEREALLDDLRTQVNGFGQARDSYRVLTSEEIRQLAEGDFLEIGTHTVTHSMLATQSLKTQRHEVLESKHQLENILGRPVKTFSYPYGGQGDIGDNTIEIVRDVGFELACANFAAPITRTANPFFLPRFLVRNWDGKEFARRLSEWFHG